MINPRLFATLKAKAEQDLRTRAELDAIIETLERSVAFAQGVLSRVHSTPRACYAADVLPAVGAAVADEIATVARLSKAASAHPYYKFNQRWTRHLQDALFTVLFLAWLGGSSSDVTTTTGTSTGTDEAAALSPAQTQVLGSGQLGRLLTLEEVGVLFGVPAEMDAPFTSTATAPPDTFHIALEEYLAALTMLADELARLAVNAVTLGDSELAVLISKFVKDLHAGFQLLNLKNDFLRKKVDGVKYAVKRVEGVIYDLALRGLLPAAADEGSDGAAAAAAAAPAAAATPGDSKMGEA